MFFPLLPVLVDITGSTVCFYPLFSSLVSFSLLSHILSRDMTAAPFRARAPQTQQVLYSLAAPQAIVSAFAATFSEAEIPWVCSLEEREIQSILSRRFPIRPEDFTAFMQALRSHPLVREHIGERDVALDFLLLVFSSVSLKHSLRDYFYSFSSQHYCFRIALKLIANDQMVLLLSVSNNGDFKFFLVFGFCCLELVLIKPSPCYLTVCLSIHIIQNAVALGGTRLNVHMWNHFSSCLRSIQPQ